MTLVPFGLSPHSLQIPEPRSGSVLHVRSGRFPTIQLSGKTLVTLMEDVRDWATFGVGISGDQDSVELRHLNRRSLGRRRVSNAKAGTVTCSLTFRIGFRAL
jgi:hypothetical protein